MAAQGLPRRQLLREPREARLPEPPRAGTGIRSGRRAPTRARWSRSTSARRGHDVHVDGRAGRRDDHGAADQHRLLRRRPALVAVLRRYPTLKFALSEGGIGWIPYFLERADYVYAPPPRLDAPGLRREAPERRVPRALRHLLHRRPGRHPNRARDRRRQHHLGVRLPALGHDLAHAPETPGALPRGRAATTRWTASRTGTRCATSASTPFAKRPRERCTVAALRAEAARRRPLVSS